MRRPPSAKVASQGVTAVRLAVERDLRWVFREQTTEDYGIDAHVEIVEDGVVSGKLLGLQIKSGVSWFGEHGPGGWWYRPDNSHLRYWTNHSLPVMVVLYHPDTGRCHWQLVSQDALTTTPAGGYKIFVPEAHVLDERARRPWTDAVDRQGTASADNAYRPVDGLGQPDDVRNGIRRGPGTSDQAAAFPAGHDLHVASPDGGVPSGATINFAVIHEVRAGRAGAGADFEQMIGLLVRAVSGQEANLVFPNPGDWGIDVVTGDLRERISAWQIKYLTEGLRHKRQIASSFVSAMKAASEHGYALERWVLCIPISMDEPALRWWYDWKTRNEQASGIAIDLWDESRLRELVIRPEAADVYRHYYAPYLAGYAAAEQPMINFAVHQVQAGMVGAHEHFSQMVARLVQATSGRDAGLLPASVDQGTDAIVGHISGRTTVWQTKYLTRGVGRNGRAQIASSFASAGNAAKEHGYVLERWVLCIPSSMDAPTLQWWHAWKAEHENDSGVAVELWDETRLRQLLLRPEAAHVYRRYYSPALKADAHSGNGAVPSEATSSPLTNNDSESLAPASGMARSRYRGHAFISYVREDAGGVDELQQILEDAGIQVWRDTADLWPGEDWRAKIREAITSDAFVFIACFSSRSLSREKSYQNEELLLAIEQLRRRQPGDPWLIPVRFDDCGLPDYDLGAGRTLASIQRADLFGPERKRAAERLVAAIRRILN